MTTIAAPRRSLPAEVRARFDLRMLVGGMIALVAVGVALAVWDAGRITVPVLAVSHELPAGHLLTANDLTTARVRLPAAQLARTLPAAEHDRIVGRALVGPAAAGDLLSGSRLATGVTLSPDDLAITVPVRTDTVYPRLRPGDAVTVLATRDRGKPSSQTGTLLPRATVYAVAAEAAISSSAGGEADPHRRLTNVTLVVAAVDAEALTHAAVNFDLTLALQPAARKGP